METTFIPLEFKFQKRKGFRRQVGFIFNLTKILRGMHAIVTDIID